MSTTRKRGRPRRVSEEACRRIVEWQRLNELCKELGVLPKTATWLRAKHRQVFK